MMVGKNTSVDAIIPLIPEDSVGVELGVWRGDSSAKFLTRARHLHLVDPWSVAPYMHDDNEFGGLDKFLERYEVVVGTRDVQAFQDYYDQVYASVAARFRNHPVTIHRCTTEEFFRVFDERVDWFYIDASHSYEECKKDIVSAMEHLSFVGMIFGDDYGNKPGVTAAVDQVAKTYSDLVEIHLHGNQYEILGRHARI